MRATFETGCGNSCGADKAQLGEQLTREGNALAEAPSGSLLEPADGGCFLVVILALLSKQASAGELFRIIDDGYPLRLLHTGATDGLGVKCPVFSLHFSGSGNDASCGLQNARKGGCEAA
jgi:hypothetical protein